MGRQPHKPAVTINREPLDIPLNRKSVQSRDDGYWAIRVSHDRGRRKRTPRYRLRCGCCNEGFDIYYDAEGLEIGGVHGSIGNWREILLPLLRQKRVN